MLRLELQPELEARLAQEAQASGLPLERYIERIVESRRLSLVDRGSAAQAAADIRELRKGVRLNGLKIKDLIEEGRRF
jgi:hypothetical protein